MYDTTKAKAYIPLIKKLYNIQPVTNKRLARIKRVIVCPYVTLEFECWHVTEYYLDYQSMDFATSNLERYLDMFDLVEE